MEKANFNKYERSCVASGPLTREVTERGELLRCFMEEINKSRAGSTYRPVTIGRVAFMVRKLKPWKVRLYALKSEMEECKRLRFETKEGKPVTPSMVFFARIKSLDGKV